MSNPFAGARRLAPVILLALSACGGPQVERELLARQAIMDPPQLWRVQALAADGAVAGEILVCADTAMRLGFDRANAEVNGAPCLMGRRAVHAQGLYANRCQLNGRPYGLTVNVAGDPTRDFTVAFALKALDGTDATARQVRRFRRMGGCPAGWKIGDQARAGAARGVNATAATWGG